MADTKPLSGLRIAVTRPQDQASDFALSIELAGGTPVMFPLLDISPLGNDQFLRESLARLPDFQLIIFISPNAVRYGVSAIQEFGQLPLRPKIAVVGQGSARALLEFGITEVIAPKSRFDSEALLALPELQAVSGWRIAIFRGEDGRALLGDTLKARGADVEYIACYRRSTPQIEVGRLLGANPDALTVTSSEALNNLWEAADDHDRRMLGALPLFVPHQRIAEAAHALGWHAVIQTSGGDEGLLNGLITWAHGRHS
jgi:uroporphyrinogen-III synthase